MESQAKTSLPRAGTGASGVGESRHASACCPTESGGGNLRFCVSPITGVDAVPEKGGDTTTLTTTLATNTDCRRTERTLPLRDSKGRFIKGGKAKTGSIGRETPIPDDSEVNMDETALSVQPTVVLTRIDDAGSLPALRRSSVSPVSGRFWAAESESDSHMSAASGGRTQGQKRPRKSDSSSGSSGEERTPRKTKTPNRGRGRPLTTGQYVGLAEAKRQLNEEKEREMRLQAEKELADMARAVQTRASSRQSDMSLSDGAVTTIDPPEDPLSRAAGYLDLLQEVTKKSKNLKGGYIKALNIIREGMKEVVQELANRNATEEVVQLRALVANLRKEKEEWKQRFSALEEKWKGCLPPKGMATGRSGSVP
ncbi:unnamed protein product [Euphydryas editha]|uniref:Uncharacterized protein n=1 Tax=Euphydryas editha TaxID=104508 RepID=A0AAU9V9F8_EUPED|nr:unnamed protein product [Euphydryas editha]